MGLLDIPIVGLFEIPIAGLLDVPVLDILNVARHCCIFSAHLFWHARASCAASAPGVYVLKIRHARTIGLVIDNLAIETS
jgi:hypothetical protein